MNKSLYLHDSVLQTIYLVYILLINATQFSVSLKRVKCVFVFVPALHLKWNFLERHSRKHMNCSCFAVSLHAEKSRCPPPPCPQACQHVMLMGPVSAPGGMRKYLTAAPVLEAAPAPRESHGVNAAQPCSFNTHCNQMRVTCFSSSVCAVRGRPLFQQHCLLNKAESTLNGRAYGCATHAWSRGPTVRGPLSHSDAVQCDSGVSVGMMQRCATALTGV